MKIVTDSRERRPFKFRKVGIVEGVITKKLDVGDYSIQGMESNVYIERKNMADLVQTITKGNKRFQKELERGQNHDLKVLIVEEPFTTLRDKKWENSHYSTVRPDILINILFTLRNKYNFQLFFCQNKAEAMSLTRYLLVNYYNCYQQGRFKDEKK